MTLIGKLLVFLNMVLAVGFVTWSLGLYTQRPDWFTATNDAGEKVDGRFTRLKNEITTLKTVADANAKRWSDGFRDLQAKEKTRADRQAVYAARLKVARDGPGDPKGPGFYDQPYLADSSGLLDLSAPLGGAPDTGPDGQPLRGADTLRAEFTANNQALALAISNDVAFATNMRGSAQLRGDQAEVGKQVRFKDEFLQKQLVVLADIRTEVEYLKRFRVNWDAQLATVLRRKEQLDYALARLPKEPVEPKKVEEKAGAGSAAALAP